MLVPDAIGVIALVQISTQGDFSQEQRLLTSTAMLCCFPNDESTERQKKTSKRVESKQRYLIQGVVQALVEVVEVAEDDGVARFHCNLDAVDVEADLAILLVIGKTRPEDDRGARHVEETLEKDETIEIGVFT